MTKTFASSKTLDGLLSIVKEFYCNPNYIALDYKGNDLWDVRLKKGVMQTVRVVKTSVRIKIIGA